MCPGKKKRLGLVRRALYQSERSTEADSHPSTPATIHLTVSYPPEYPDAPPDLSLTTPPDAPKHPHLILPDDTPHLLSTLTSTITESLGAAMIFTLISTLKEAAETLIQTRQAAVQAELDRDKHKAEEAENAKFHGEAVTRGSFLAWRAKFRAEMEREAEGRKRVEDEGRTRKEVRRDEEVRVSGRELWERGLVGKGEEDGGEEEERDALAGVETLTVAD